MVNKLELMQKETGLELFHVHMLFGECILCKCRFKKT
jgi:hypothetical protein